ncbi:hypothetical protein RRG08_014121 [Elysia crispata]|uniref:PiggyBac transposable element-derived protein domain-containing protein n=1 Tax=Elysia crispata TaxID=231223 RepID=A0AAE0ZT94_9GAST|nr:hypothetical protein RRG08_014121 [Elysia crispata]
MTVDGTLRRNKSFLPEEFKDPKKPERGKPKFVFRKWKTLVSYKSGAKKNVILVSAMHDDGTIVNTSGHKQLPEIVDFYNSTKGGVDCMDLMAHSMSTKRQIKGWPMVIFFNILDIASIAAVILFRQKFPANRLAQIDARRFFQSEIG